MKNEPDIIPIDCPIPTELILMMEDYKAIANHLISSGLYHKIGLERHYYPIVSTDKTEKPKPIPPERELRDLSRGWFNEHYKGKYAAHYLDSASSFAMQQIKSWRTNGGDITAIPHIRNPIARLNNDLYTIQESRPDGTMRIRITIAPHQSVIMDIKVNHRHFSEWSLNRPGALVIVPYGLRLCFTDDTSVPKSKESAAYDFNFNRVVIARSDGQIKEIDLSDVMTIRKNNEILTFVGSRHLGVEDLHGTTKDILVDDRGTRFNTKMSSWIHGAFEDIIVHHHSDSKLYYTRGTSKYCPFCSSQLTHPIWKQSKCPECGLFDRDMLESVSGLVRTNSRHKKGEPWAVVKDVFPQIIENKLLYSSKLMIRGLPLGYIIPESVYPECAVLSPEAQSDIDIRNNDVMLENRSDVYDSTQRVIGSVPNLTESGDDANSEGRTLSRLSM